jgi:hypothetical protein
LKEEVYVKQPPGFEDSTSLTMSTNSIRHSMDLNKLHVQGTSTLGSCC